MLCMAITCVFCVQFNVVALDRVEHTLGIDHHANPLAGSIVAVDHQHDHDDDGSDPTHPLSHAHSGDSCASGIVLTSAPSSPLKFMTAAVFSVKERVASGGFTSRVDRPPKA